MEVKILSMVRHIGQLTYDAKKFVYYLIYSYIQKTRQYKLFETVCLWYSLRKVFLLGKQTKCDLVR